MFVPAENVYDVQKKRRNFQFKVLPRGSEDAAPLPFFYMQPCLPFPRSCGIWGHIGLRLSRTERRVGTTFFHTHDSPPLGSSFSCVVRPYTRVHVEQRINLSLGAFFLQRDALQGHHLAGAPSGLPPRLDRRLSRCAVVVIFIIVAAGGEQQAPLRRCQGRQDCGAAALRLQRAG